MRRNERIDHTRPAAEMLETRISPASLPLLDLSGGTLIAAFTDADGDKVTVRIEGSAGKVEFQDAGGSSVDDGENIASVKITGASADFVLSYSITTLGGGDAIVNMGNITSDKVLRGIISIPPSNSTGTFALGSFVGPGFSAGGSLSADDVTGNAEGVGIEVNSLGPERFIHIRRDFFGDLIILGRLGGSITVGGVVDAESAWQFNRAVTPDAQIAVKKDFFGTFEARGVFAGDITIGGDAPNAWTFGQNVLKSAQLTAAGWDDILVSKNWSGQLNAQDGDITMSVEGQMLGTSVINGEGPLILEVDGNVQAGAIFGISSHITATVRGNIAGHWVASHDVILTVGGNVVGTEIRSGARLELTVAKSILKSKLNGIADLHLEVTGNVNSTHVTSVTGILSNLSGNLANSKISANNELGLNVGGSMFRSQTSGRINVIVGVSGQLVETEIRGEGTEITDATMSIAAGQNIVRSTITGVDISTTFEGRNLIASTVYGRNIPTARLSGSILNSDVITDGDAVVGVTGNVIGSTITSSLGNVSLGVGRNFLSSSASCDEHLSIIIDGNMRGLLNSFTSNIALEVGGSMSGKAIAGAELTADIGQLSGSLSADILDLIVQGDVAASARLQARTVNDVSGDTGGFRRFRQRRS
jgi:hypothetical protein